MRQHYLKSIVSVLAVSVTALCFSQSAVAAKTLRFGSYFGTEMDHIAEEMKETVANETDGEIRIQYSHSGEIASADQFLEAVASGTLDFAYGVGSYWPGLVDLGNIEAGLPGAWGDVDEAKEMLSELRPLLAEAYEENGVILLGHGFGSYYDLITMEPVESIDDLDGLKIRATSQWADVLEPFGVRAVFLPIEEAYVALSTGVIDGILYGGPLDYSELKFNELAKNYTFMNVLYPGWTETIIVNPNTWNSLSDQERDILSKAINKYAEDIHNLEESENERFIAADDGAFIFGELPAEDSKKIIESAQTVWDQEAQKSERNTQAIEILRANAKEQGRLD